MPLTDPQSLHPLPGTTVTPITQRRVIITPDPHRRGYNTSEFWVSVFALLLSWLDAHFASAGSSTNSSLSAAIIAAAYTAGRTYAKTPRVSG